MSSFTIQVQNTRLFPKNFGAKGYKVTGIASRCDWVVLTDTNQKLGFVHGNLLQQPTTVYLSLRSDFFAFQYFFKEVLPLISSKFILITGSEDITLPKQVDARWRAFTASEEQLLTDIRLDNRVIHWFAENLSVSLPKMTPLPLGYVFPNDESDFIQAQSSNAIFSKRPLKVLCSHRVRDGAQWEPRRVVTNLCMQYFNTFSTILHDEVTFSDFEAHVREHPFVLCVEGGGLDPSPKAWVALINGSIPIIKSSALDSAYSQLPVIIINDWTSDCISPEKLKNWLTDLAPYFENDSLRSDVIHRLSIDYWWGKISEYIPNN